MENTKLSKAQTAKENKVKLINMIINDIIDDPHSYEEFMNDLLFEALSKRTQKQLKAILN